MKKFNFIKRLLLVLMVLMTCSPQTKAASYPLTVNMPYVYLDNTDLQWDGANFVVGKSNYSTGYLMTNIGHTKLFYREIPDNWSDATGVVFINATAEWGGEWTGINDRCSGLSNRTQFKWDNEYESMDYHGTYYCTSSSSTSLDITYLSGGYPALNKSQTVYKYTRGDGESSFSGASVNSGTITISAYKMTDNGKASNTSNSATISAAGTTSASVDAAYTGEVTVTAEANTGYVFMGWYGSANGTDKLSSSSSYTYNAPNSAGSIYARFAEKLPVGKRLYLATNSDWRASNAKFEAVFCNASTQQWESCTLLTGTDDMYYVDVPSGDWGCVIFCKMDPAGPAHDWDGKWCQTNDMYKDGVKNCVYINGSCDKDDRWGKYAPVPALVGTMNNWDPVASQYQFTDGQLVLSNLSANSGYQFLVAVGRDNYWYGYGGADNTLTYVGQTDAITLTAGNNNMAIATAGTGDYTFKWVGTTLEVDFPSVGHPSTDYVYVVPYAGWSKVNAHLWGGTYGTVYNYDPQLNTVTIYGSDYYYTAIGDHDKIAFGQGVSDGNKTPSLGESDASQGPKNHKGEYYDYSSGGDATSSWKDFTATLALDHQGATNTPAPNNITVSFNKTTNLTGDVLATDPEKNGYSFGGYYTEQGGSGSQFINASGNVQNVSGYISSGKWIRTGSEATSTVYAKWTQSVTLNKHNGADNESVTLTYNSSSHDAITNPTRTGYTFTGWYEAADGDDLVIDTDGTLQNSTSYTDASGKWTNSGSAPTLHAHWTEDTHNVSVEAGANGSIKNAVSSVTGVGIATASSEVEAVPNSGYDFVNWTLPSGVTAAATYSATSNPIKINATEDGKTITANFTEHTYNITLIAGDHGADDGSASVVFNTNELASVSHVSANAGYQLIGYYDGATKVLNADGKFADDDVTGYITDGNWSKTSDATLTAKFATVTLTFNSGLYWNSSSNWTPNCVPTIEHDVIIQKTCRITNKDAKAKSVKIDSYLEGDPRLYVEDGGGLVVAEGITAKHKSDGSYEHTTDRDLWIRTDDDNNSGLICGNASSNTEATYIFYSKVYRWESYYINQYVGIPYTTMSPYQWYGVYVFEYDDANDAWKNPDDGDLKPFTAYDIISKSSDENYTTFYTDGILNLPGTSGTKTLTCTGTRCKSDGTFDAGGDFLFANSWTAPISVAAFESTDYSSITPSVYIFNAGYIPAGSDTKILGEYSGTWSTISFDAAAYTDNSVIPATQAFLVTAKAAGATLTLDYGKHVYTPALSGGINNAPLKAPKRSSNEEAPARLKMTVQIDSVNADVLYLFERGDFTTSFDEGWDGYKVMGESFAPQLYAINGESILAIDAVPELDNTEIGFKAGTLAGEYTFAFDYNDDEPLYLYDKDTKEVTQIDNEATYSFTTNDMDEHDRFMITRSNAPQVVTGYEEIEGEKVKRAEKFIENNTLFIRRGGRIYDAQGALVK